MSRAFHCNNRSSSVHIDRLAALMDQFAAAGFHGNCFGPSHSTRHPIIGGIGGENPTFLVLPIFTRDEQRRLRLAIVDWRGSLKSSQQAFRFIEDQIRSASADLR